MGILTFVHFFSFFTQLFLAIYVFLQNRRSWLNRSCAALIGSFAIWSFGRIFVHNYQTTKAAATLFENISSIGWCSFSAFFLWFVLVLTQQRKILSKRVIYLALFLPPLVTSWTASGLEAMTSSTTTSSSPASLFWIRLCSSTIC